MEMKRLHTLTKKKKDKKQTAFLSFETEMASAHIQVLRLEAQ